jgi:hypothetical protein
LLAIFVKSVHHSCVPTSKRGERRRRRRAHRHASITLAFSAPALCAPVAGCGLLAASVMPRIRQAPPRARRTVPVGARNATTEDGELFPFALVVFSGEPYYSMRERELRFYKTREDGFAAAADRGYSRRYFEVIDVTVRAKHKYGSSPSAAEILRRLSGSGAIRDAYTQSPRNQFGEY